MNRALCQDFIYHLHREGIINAGSAPQHIQQWFEGLGLPSSLLRLMRWAWPQEDCKVAHIRLRSSASIFAEKNAPFTKNKFLYIGSAPNGDMLVIDYSTEACAAGFITHEEWNPWCDEPEDPRNFFEPIAPTFDSFLFRVVEHRYLPMDYHAAKRFNHFLADESKGT